MVEASSSSIAVVGSLNVDSVVHTERFPAPGETLLGRSHALFPGGKGANQAYGAAKLAGPHVRVSMVGQVGSDGYGEWLKRNLAAGGVDVGSVITDANVSSGVASITINDRAQNHIIVVPGANGSFTPERLHGHADVLRAARVLLVQLEIPLATVERAIALGHDSGAFVILDPAPAQPLCREMLALCDFITPNENELRSLLGRAADEAPLNAADAVAGARALQERGARTVIVKMGSAGALCVTLDEVVPFAPFIVEAVDTTAAGDAWNAGFAVALAEGAPLHAAGRTACAAAAISVGRAGAQPSMPTRAEVEQLLRSHS